MMEQVIVLRCTDCGCVHQYFATTELHLQIVNVTVTQVRCKCLDDPQRAWHVAGCSHGKCLDPSCDFPVSHPGRDKKES